jgi:hypothetical protein
MTLLSAAGIRSTISGALTGNWDFQLYFSNPAPDAINAAKFTAQRSILMVFTFKAWLIRTGRKHLHRQIGKAYYALVAFLILATTNLVHFRIHSAGPLTNVGLYFLALVLNSIVVFLCLYALAIYHRRTPAIHARYMICTLFPFVTPVTDRIIAVNFPSLLREVPVIDGAPVVPVIGFALADIILVALTLWDWRSGRRLKVFPIALVLVLIYHAGVLSFYRFGFWRSFGEWFLSLPLS